ncbi:MAG: CBS domain-containing protein [Pseudomonadota bacterium]
MTVKTILDEKGNAVFSMPPSATLAEVASELASKRIGALLIMEGETLSGILSERDVVRALAKDGAAALSAPTSHYMTQAVETCGIDDLIDDVMERMTAARFRHLPVVDDGKVIGLVSIGDVVKQRIEAAVRERDDMRAYILSS